MPTHSALEALLVVLAVAAAAWLRPWRAWPQRGPPWIWICWWALLPLLWSADRLAATSGIAVAPPLSGASLMLLLSGWPLAVLALAGTALLCATLGALDAALALHRLLWLGVLPATVALAVGAAARRWLPNHLFVYIFVRGFFGTLLAAVLPGWLALALAGAGGGVLSIGDLAVGHWLAAWAEAIVSGMLVAIFVAYRPQWLATYSDSLYLPRR